MQPQIMPSSPSAQSVSYALKSNSGIRFAARVGLCLSGVSLSGGISGGVRSGSLTGTGGIISGSGRLGSVSMICIAFYRSGQPFDGTNVPPDKPTYYKHPWHSLRPLLGFLL